MLIVEVFISFIALLEFLVSMRLYRNLIAIEMPERKILLLQEILYVRTCSNHNKMFEL